MVHQRLDSLRSSVALLAAVYVFTPLASGQSESPSYRLALSTLNGGGAQASSKGYLLDGSLGQELVIGASSSPHMVLQSGFWSFGGSGLIPVVLSVHKDTALPAEVELLWSGNNPPYNIYRSTDCASVFAGFLASEPANTHIDSPPPHDRLICYNVLATAPGPIAPSRADQPLAFKAPIPSFGMSVTTAAGLPESPSIAVSSSSGTRPMATRPSGDAASPAAAAMAPMGRPSADTAAGSLADRPSVHTAERTAAGESR